VFTYIDLLQSVADVDGTDSTSRISQLSGLSQLSLSPTLRAHAYITLGTLDLIMNQFVSQLDIVHVLTHMYANVN